MCKESYIKMRQEVVKLFNECLAEKYIPKIGRMMWLLFSTKQVIQLNSKTIGR